MKLFLFLLIFFVNSESVEISVAPRDKVIPALNKGMVFEAVVLSSDRRILPLKFFVSRDGLTFEVNGKLEREDNQGNLIYSALIPAPKKYLRVLSYAVLDFDSVARSNVYTLVRPCLDIDRLNEENVDALPVEKLPQLNDQLLQEIEMYQNLIRQIDGLAKLLDK
ncbi:MAG: hypothetical protein NZO16_03460 [Deltaproteobacteria bacterium]|nr:hypothetical protein [Deltaproteobacteria bacterium]